MKNTQDEAAKSSGFAQWLAGIPAGRRSKWLVLVVWIAILAVASPYAAQLSDVESNDGSDFLPAGAESVEVQELLEQFDDADTVPAVVAYERADGLTESDFEAIENDRQALAAEFPEDAIGDVMESPSGEAAIFNIEVSEDYELLEEEVPLVREIAQGADGLDVYVTGAAGFSYDAIQIFGGINLTLLIASAVVVTILLLIIYRSPFVWIMPLLVVGFAHQLATGSVYAMITQLGVVASAQNNGILAILIFGVGTDYALLIIARYKEELRNYEDDHVAMTNALRRAGPAILASGGTTILGLLCLLLADLNSTRGLGPIGAAGIASAFLAMLTLLPAILVIVGRRVFWPFIPRYGEVEEARTSIWDRIGNWISGRPRPIWISATLAMVILIGGMLTLGDDLTQEESFRGNPESLQGQQALARHFTAGASAPTTIVADARATEAVLQTAGSTEGVADVFPTGESGDLVSFGAVLEAEPESDAAFAIIERLRDGLSDISEGNALVGGPDATALDTQTANTRDRWLIMPAVLFVVLAVLIVLMRSIVAPLLMVGTSIISFHAALGVVAFFFTQILGYSGISDYVILLSFVFLITLGVDYNIFLMTRIQEEAATHDTAEATRRGLSVTGGVITSAGIVLGATFLVLTVLPLMELLQLGVIVAVGVLLETMLVRSIVLPTMVMDLGEWTWWPGKTTGSRAASDQSVLHSPSSSGGAG